ncbi:uncharacterized protein LOC126739402 isoform X2 [Anthonomus grandis grandis]|uniref:uncharacterized protein LOC126739402 isoform X2 n=1 Tax=Anthonomus grandis grandis TaxID=2921223 RepID=UPI0021655BD9|nr:uncharacterized protein LOC126739402 isoform X2 [Anthonomus grandis grandis]
MKSAERFKLVFVPGTLVLVCTILGFSVAQTGHTICDDVPGCNCTMVGGWRNVNCLLRDDQDLKLQEENIPKLIAEISLSGGQSITFGTKTFTNLRGLSAVQISNVKTITIEARAFFKLTSSSLLLRVFGCDNLVLRHKAFDEIESSLSTEMEKIQEVSLENSPFNNLGNCTFKDIGILTMDSGAFDIRNLGLVGRHGPATVVLFVNVYIPKINTEVFKTVLAEVAFKDCRVDTVKTEAFKAVEINSIRMQNTTFHTIESKAIDGMWVSQFEISNCTIHRISSGAITDAGIVSMIVNYSKISDIESSAITSTTNKLELIGNEIRHLRSHALNIKNWNKIVIEENHIKHLSPNFLVLHFDPALVQSASDGANFFFKGNYIYDAKDGCLEFVRGIKEGKLLFDDNYFDRTCGCDLDNWFTNLTKSPFPTSSFLSTSFCKVDSTLSKCFSLPAGIINMANFTEMTCANNTVCEPYNGETLPVNVTKQIFTEDDHNESRKWLILIVVFVGISVLTLVGTFVMLLVRGSRWLKRKGYFRNNYYGNNQSNEDEENTIVTVDTENEKLEIPEELTQEFLQELSRRLDDPATHQEASDIIERLYETFVVDESYENNNREEEAHLYEELGNLNLQIPPPPYEEHPSPTTPAANTTPRSILKLMEEKFNTTGSVEHQRTLDLSCSSTSTNASTKPILTGDYSEPIDKEEAHLYSELKQKDEGKTDSVKSRNSVQLRPLPDKPGYIFEAGPSSKL